MSFVLMMWVVWGALAVITAALYVYRSSLTRDEEGQVFLDEAFDHEKVAQAAIVERVNKIEPALRVSLRIAAAATAIVLVYYAVDIVHQFR
jgi:hypothetical protein